MAAKDALVPQTSPAAAQGKIHGAKNATLATLAAGINSAIDTYLDGTSGTHTTVIVEYKIKVIS